MEKGIVKAFGIAALLTILSVCVVGATAGMAEAAKQIKFGLTVASTSPYAIACQNMAKKIAERSNGSLKVDFFYDSALGSDREMQEAMLLGALEMSICGPANFTYTVPEYAFFDLPGLFPDREAYYAFWKTDAAREVSMLLLKAGIRPLAFIENGFYQISNSKREASTIEELKGLKIRSMENDIQVLAWQGAGLLPSIIPFSEVYLALQQRVLDAQETSIGTFMSMKFYETQKFLSVSNRFMHVMTIVVGESFWKSLSDEEREIVQTAAAEASAEHHDYLTADVDKMLQDLQEKHGVKVTYFSPEEVGKWTGLSQKAYDATRKINPELYDKFMAAVKETLSAYKK